MYMPNVSRLKIALKVSFFFFQIAVVGIKGIFK